MPQPFVILPATDAGPAGEWFRLGHDAHAAGRMPDAERHYGNVLRLSPGHPAATHNLGILFAQTGRLNDGLLAMDRAAIFDPTSPLIAANRAFIYLEAERVGEALEAARAAVGLSAAVPPGGDPLAVAGYQTARLAFAMISAAGGHPGAALPAYREMLAVDPKHPAAAPNAAFIQTLMPETPKDLLAQRKVWHAAHAARIKVWPHGNDKDPDRTLRVGYVGGDFKSHSAAMMFSNVLLNHDPARVQPYFYSALPTNPVADDLTAMFMAAAKVEIKVDDDGEDLKHTVRVSPESRWREIAGLTDEAADDLIRKDRIDILVDLAAHTNGGRLGLFTRKPAPVQVTAWGFAHGTGVPEIDAFLADPVAVPESERGDYAERVVDLPCIVTYRPPAEYGLKATSPLPYWANEYVTFGSFSRFEKLSDECLASFAEILRRVPDSRLYLKDHAFRRPYSIRRVLGAMPDVDPKRLSFGISTSHPEHLQTYQSVDLYLDTWPHGAGIVTLECLYMGVPLLTRYGTQPAGRTASSVLTQLGRTDWITRTRDEFVAKAVELAGKPQELAKARKTLREELVGSPVVKGYAGAVEEAYRGLWREWCAK